MIYRILGLAPATCVGVGVGATAQALIAAPATDKAVSLSLFTSRLLQEGFRFNFIDVMREYLLMDGFYRTLALFCTQALSSVKNALREEAPSLLNL